MTNREFHERLPHLISAARDLNVHLRQEEYEWLKSQGFKYDRDVATILSAATGLRVHQLMEILGELSPDLRKEIASQYISQLSAYR